MRPRLAHALLPNPSAHAHICGWEWRMSTFTVTCYGNSSKPLRPAPEPWAGKWPESNTYMGTVPVYPRPCYCHGILLSYHFAVSMERVRGVSSYTERSACIVQLFVLNQHPRHTHSNQKKIGQKFTRRLQPFGPEPRPPNCFPAVFPYRRRPVG